MRPRVHFGRTSKRGNILSCRKHYTTSDTHYPGIFTVQCFCRNPKLIGISVMLECEGISTAVSVLLSRFLILPRVTYYDNGCNMSKSIVLRVPWVKDESTIVCDRFHYKSHGCNSINDPGSYPSCEHHSTSGVESLNHLWSTSKSHLRYLRPDNLMPFLCIRAKFLNVRTILRKKEGKVDIDVGRYRELVQNLWMYGHF